MIKTLERNFPHMQLTNANINLRTYSGENISPLGMCKVNVKLDDQQEQELNLFVVEKGRPPLFGCEWLKNLELNRAEIKAL